MILEAIFKVPNFYSHISEKDINSLALVNKPLFFAIRTVRFQKFDELRSKIRQIEYPDPLEPSKTSLCIDSKDEPLLSILGCGGSKRAIQLSDGRALLTPNTSVDLYPWMRMAREEIRMSRILNQLGLLTSSPEPVLIEKFIPAYIAPTFGSLQEKGMSIIDAKNSKSSTWISGKDSLFASDEERFNSDNWSPILDPFVEDIAKLLTYHIPAWGDAFNYAVVKDPSGTYHLRFFGFDFSSKSESANIPSEKLIAREINEGTAKRQLLNHLDMVIFLYDNPTPQAEWKKLKPKRQQLLETLLEKYLPVILRRSKELPRTWDLQ